MIKIVIPLPPITKKNSQQILKNPKTGKPFVMPSKKYKEYEAAAAYHLPKGVYISTPVNVKCLFYMPTRRRVDLTNLLEAADDLLVHAKILSDDDYNVIQSHDGSRVYVDKYNPRTEIYIEATDATRDALQQTDAQAAEIERLRESYEYLQKRFAHLLKSKLIQSYDEHDPRTRRYKNNIATLDNQFFAYKQAHTVLTQCTTCNECASASACQYVSFGDRVVYNCPHYVASCTECK